jgi:hypothetical protein
MSGPVEAKAWACDTCKRLYSLDAGGKEFARYCCICPGCGGMSELLGGEHMCKKCLAERSVESCRQAVTAAESNLVLAERTLTALSKPKKAKKP